ncbi:hypothetical protein JHK84_035446 [Glycine max]|nr:hypothetical protein JHK84_035446 [Glycine max]
MSKLPLPPTLTRGFAFVSNTDMWFAPLPTDRIHAIVKKEDLECWEVEVKEGKTYYMYNFRLVPNDDQYRVCAHPFKFYFTCGTTMRKVLLLLPPELYSQNRHYGVLWNSVQKEYYETKRTSVEMLSVGQKKLEQIE